ncbi:MAG TPA: DoxX family protein [Xanthobacteraceae bacterium]|jgi:putative oxidoreductase|nr:DoxX family protein [Xanthobacteraceae bacterium]
MNGQVDQKSLIIPGLAGLYSSLAPYGYALIRFSAGAILMYHGYAKLFNGFAPVVADKVLAPMGFPAPLAWAYWLGILEFFGAGLLAIGFLTRPIALMLAVEMAIVTFVSHWGNGYFFSAPRGGYEYPLLLMLLYIGIFMRGGGRCSVDRLIGKEF